MTTIFVSYRRKDSEYVASTINEKLAEYFGRENVFFDIDAIPLGVDFRKHISDAVGKCDVLIAIIGDTWNSAADDEGNRRIDDPADSVRLEIEAALARNIPLIPVLVGSARMPQSTDLPSTIRDLVFRNAAEVRPGRDLQQHLTRLLTGIEAAIRREHPKPAADTTSYIHTTQDSAVRNVSSASVGTTRRESRPRPNIRQRRIISALVIVCFSIAGWGAGAITASIAGNGAGFFAAPLWIAGIVLVYRAWRHWPGT